MSGEGGVQNSTDSCLKLEKIEQMKMCFFKQNGWLIIANQYLKSTYFLKISFLKVKPTVKFRIF